MNPVLGDALFDSLIRLGKMGAVERVLLISDTDIPNLDRLKPLRKKLVFAVERAYVAEKLEHEGHNVVLLPGFTASRTDRLKAALVGAVGSELLEVGQEVLIGNFHMDPPIMDALFLLNVDDEQDDHSSLAVSNLSHKLSPQLMEVVVNLALTIGQQGYEGYALGALFVVGESTDVMERSHPLTMNPFQGYSEAERNLFDPMVRDAVRTFAMLDGAFIVRDDGVVLTAGRHIQVSKEVKGLPLGLGARHTAAASISAETDAVAVVVSQSSGAVRLFNEGRMELEIIPSGRRGEDSSQSKKMDNDEIHVFDEEGSERPPKEKPVKEKGPKEKAPKEKGAKEKGAKEKTKERRTVEKKKNGDKKKAPRKKKA